jgi:hypothetical protein
MKRDRIGMVFVCITLLSGCATSVPEPQVGEYAGVAELTVPPDEPEVDIPPVIKTSVTPDLSSWDRDTLRRYGTATTVIGAVINVEGVPENVRIVRSDDAEIADAVAKAFWSWRFTPAVRDGKTVRCGIIQPVTMRMKSEFRAEYIPRIL